MITLPGTESDSLAYTPPAGHYDEIMAPDGDLREHARRLGHSLGTLGAEEWVHRSREIRGRLIRNGVTYNTMPPLGEKAGEHTGERLWSLDPVPHIVPSQDWSRIEAGLLERAELLERILQDLYGPRHLVRDGLVPADFLFAHPGFLRPMCAVEPVGGKWLHLYSADVARDTKGELHVIGDRAQNPSGMGYALENRMVLSRVLPSLFRDSMVHRLAGFFARLRQALFAGAIPSDETLVVLMTPGPESETFFEHGYLADYLGLPLVKGEDLEVRNGHVHLRTLAEARRVHGIVRRVDDWFCDPLELRGDSLLGSAGLLEVLRRQGVTLFNPLGTGVVNNSTIMPFLPAIARKWLGRDLRLPSVRTLWCGETVSRSEVLDRMDTLVIKRIDYAPRQTHFFGPRLSARERVELVGRIQTRPWSYVGQEILELSTAPCLVEQELQARRIVMRGFLASDSQGWFCMPGGLTRATPNLESLNVTGREGGLSKDTWILSTEPEAIHSAENSSRDRARVRINRRAREIPGHTAESLFWAGRYLERSEGLCRLLRECAYNSQSHAEREEGSVLEAVVSMLPVGPALRSDQDGWPQAVEATLNTLATSSSQVGALPFSLKAARRNLREARHLLPDQAWSLTHSLSEAQSAPSGLGSAGLLLTAEERLGQLAALAGIFSESMQRGPVKDFLDLGKRLERGLFSLACLGRAFEGGEGPTSGVLRSLVLMHDSARIYQNRYPAGFEVSPVLDLLWLDGSNPRALAFQLGRVEEILARLPGADPTGQGHEQRLALDLAVALLELNPDHEQLGTMMPAGGERFFGLIERLQRGLEELSEILTLRKFRAQAPPQSLREWK